MSNSKHLIVIVGPTAVGKTTLCVELAKQLDCEILSADSRQFYQEMSIGTAKPTTQEMDGVKHHFINNLSIHDYYDVGKYEKDVLKTLDRIFEKNDIAILTGGSGLYIDVVCKGMDEMPAVDDDVRAELNAQVESQGLEMLTEELKKVDSEYYARVDLQNPQRVIRALEVYRSTGMPYSIFRKNTAKERPFGIVKIGLDRDREELYHRIDQRMDIMLDQGLEEETKTLEKYRSHNALQTVGYKELFEYIDGKYDWEEAVRLLKRNSRRYAKRQLTWFRRDEEIHWFHPNQKTEILDYINQSIA